MAGKKASSENPLKPLLIFCAVILVCGIAFRSLNRGSLSSRLPAHPSVRQLKEGDCRDINADQPGQKIELARYTASGKYTIFEFTSAYCGACSQISPMVEELTKFRPDIAVRRIDVNRSGVEGIDWASPVCKQYNIHRLPSFRIVDSHGVLLADGEAASRQVMDCLKELQ